MHVGSAQWFNDPVAWVLMLPALVATGLLIQMISSLFTCCGTFRIQGRSIVLRWWMIPAAVSVSLALWLVVVIYAVSTG